MFRAPRDVRQHGDNTADSSGLANAAGEHWVLVGGGLQNALLALALLARRPQLQLTLIERDTHFGGNHTWCFHEQDVPASARHWFDALIVKTWPAYHVFFPGHERTLQHSYGAISSAHLHQVLSQRLASAPNARWLTASAQHIAARHVVTDQGEVHGDVVVDARGPQQTQDGARHFQKFLGLEVELEPGSAPPLPWLMDARVQQYDGYRFMYVLPFDTQRVLLEDTYYSDSPQLERELLRSRVHAYAQQHGLRVRQVVREESGVLPLPTRSVALPDTPYLAAGYAGGYFHPTTGYSLPAAVRLAEHAATHSLADLRGADFQLLQRHLARQRRFCVALNRLLFAGFEPSQRYHVLERFYRLPSDTIRRFYALETTAGDRARILCGRPPRGFSPRRYLFQGTAA